MRWIDTKTTASLKHARLPDGSVNLVIVGLRKDSQDWANAIAHMKMRVSKSGKTLMRAGGRFTLDEVRKVFPDAVPSDMPESEIYLGVVASQDTNVPPRKMSAEERRARADIQTYIPLGVNYLGQEVFTMSDGMRFVSATTGAPISESSAALPAAFLRAASDEDMALCADGFVRQMDKRMMRAEDLRRFGGVIFDEDVPLKVSDGRLRRIQEVVEASIFRNFAAEHEDASLEAFERAIHIDNHQPVMAYRNSDSVAFQQYSTPLLLSVAVQHVVGDVKGKKLLEPTIGNGSLVSLLRGADITGVEIDPARSKQVGGLFGGDSLPDIVTGDFTALSQTLPADFDVIVSNPPFGGLDKPVPFMGLQATRIDHLIALQALSRRKADGAGVFIVGADHDGIYAEGAGKITGGSQRFFAWLFDHYEIKAFEVAGSMYAKQGANYPVRVVAVGKRLSDAEAATRKKGGAHRLSELEVVRTPDELWAAAVSTRAWLSKTSISADEVVEVAKVKSEYQAQYIPLSKVGESSSMVPVNLAAPMASAFAKLEKAIGNVDEFVKKELQMKSLEVFGPEQIDAIALAIYNARRGRGLILADQTGQGKGRVVAALARYSALNDRVAMFLTDTPNLFSDFWRDIKDIGSEDLFNPFILNLGENVIDIIDTGEVEIPKTSPSIQRQVLSSMKSPKEFGYNLALMTYSQFNRTDSPKSAWLAKASEGAYLIMDESHKAAGESNTSAAVARAIKASWSATYSSATYAKDAKNMLIYSKAFPPSVNLETLAQTLEVGGAPLQEVISSMLCDDGVLIRRERDLSHLSFEMVSPNAELLRRNRDVADKVSAVLSLMSFISGDVEKVVGREFNRIQAILDELPEEVRANNRMGVSYVNFGSRLYTIQRQLMLILAADTVVDESKRILASGGKPVIAVEQTMETLLKEFIVDESDAANAPITFNDLLHRMANGIAMISRRDAYGNAERVSVFDVMGEQDASRDDMSKVMKELTDRINEVPKISAMPLDVIKQGLEDAGYTIGEISGRDFETRIIDGRVEVLPRNVDRSTEVFAFNNDGFDGILLTGGAAATGISLHASEKFSDQRQRILIEAQIANDVARRVQLFGRVDRRGQVSSPGIRSVTSGLPSEVRVLAMQNQKLRSMSANTQSNRSSASEMKDIPDILNTVGDYVCREYLFSNPDIARTLSIDLSDDKEDPVYFVNKLTGRISLLPVAKQEDIFEALLENYNIHMAELNAMGVNPFVSHSLDVGGEVVKSFVLHEKGGGDSLFDAPIIAEKIEWVEMVEPMRSAQVKARIEQSIAALTSSGSIKEVPNTNLFGGVRVMDMEAFMGLVHQSFLDLAVKSLPAKFAKMNTETNPIAGVEAALEDKKDNIIKKIDKRHDWVDKFGRKLTPGRTIRWNTPDGLKTGVITDLTLPPEGKEHHLGQWGIAVAVPGEERLSSLTFNQLFEDEKHVSFNGFDAIQIGEKFDAAKQGEVVFSRWLLTGNLFAAAESAAKTQIGRAGVVTMKDGSHRRAIICGGSVNESTLRYMPITLSTPEECLQRLHGNISQKSSGTMSFGEGFSLTWRNEVMTIQTPGGKRNGGRLFLDEEVRKVFGDFAGSKEKMIARFDTRDAAKMEMIVRKFYGLGLSGDVTPTAAEEPRMAA